MKVYLDTCVLQRPFDDRRQPRIDVEASAVLILLGWVEAGKITLIGSDFLDFEVGRITDGLRKSQVLALLSLAGEHVHASEEIRVDAVQLGQLGIRPLDALHLASAASAQADVFCSTDRQLVNRSTGMFRGVRVLNPIDLVLEVDHEE